MGLFSKEVCDFCGKEAAASKVQRVIEDTKGRNEYRKLIDIDKNFNRKHWKEVSDQAEKDYFGKTIKG